MTDPKKLKFWRELHEGYVQTGCGYEVICRQFKEALDEIDRLNALLQPNENTVPKTKNLVFPKYVSDHAVERLMERHLQGENPPTSHGEARDTLLAMMARARYEEGTWNPGDLDGLGQSIWCDRGTGIKLVVDGNGVVRTVLP